ncbi:MAG: hypothetical protein FWE48_05390, partial [Coriobacteriia bacterium]|nr:hypothetical protein [Coriobacteriia bacterium]
DSHMTMTPSLAEYGDLKPYLAPISEEGCYTHIHYQPHDKDSLCPHHATASIELIYCCPEWAPTDNCEEVYITVFEDDWGKVLNSTISQS